QVSQLHLERGGLVAEAAEAYAQKHGIKPAGQDKFRIAAFGIDVQDGFCTPGASLFVPGAVEDSIRTVEWLYRNLDRITGLFPSMMEAALFHAHARKHQTHFETKGTHAMTENYSVLSPEVTEVGGQVVGGFNTSFFKMLMEYDRVYVFGQAKSHCVLSTVNDIQEHLQKTDPRLAEKIWILEDAMS